MALGSGKVHLCTCPSLYCEILNHRNLLPMPLTCTQVKSLEEIGLLCLLSPALSKRVLGSGSGKNNSSKVAFPTILHPHLRLTEEETESQNKQGHELYNPCSQSYTLGFQSPARLGPSSAHFSGPAPVFKIFQSVIFLVQPLPSGSLPPSLQLLFQIPPTHSSLQPKLLIMLAVWPRL